MEIDIEELRKDLIEECYGAYFGGGFGGALIETSELEKFYHSMLEYCKKVTIYATDGSYAQVFAKEHNLKFICE